MSRSERAQRINNDTNQLSVRQQCELLELNRSTLYYKPIGPSEETQELLGVARSC